MEDIQDEIVLHSPLDMHVHFRNGLMMEQVVPLTAKTFAGAMVMPNTDPIIACAAQAEGYRSAIMRHAEGTVFEPYMTLYLQPYFDRALLEEARPDILAVKFYPKGLTNNSARGCDPADPRVLQVLGLMEELDIPLCVHAEAPGYYHDRERLFHPYLQRWATACPRLRIILEHVSDQRSLLLLMQFENVFATIAPHHLLLTGDDWVGPPLKPHLYCMPVAKRPEDREALMYAVLDELSSVFSKLMLGTDSAPHDVARKECAEGCAGAFTAPIALQLLAGLFARHSTQERFQAFVSGNARRIYRIKPLEKTIRLVRKPFVIPARYHDVVPMWAGKIIEWTVESIV